VASDPSGRDTGCPVFIIRQRYEPPDFIGYFSVWNKDMWDVSLYNTIQYRPSRDYIYPQDSLKFLSVVSASSFLIGFS